jgi:DNA-nicking Smr family endonuclease
MKRAKKSAKELADWHLWSEVTKSVSPLKPQKTALLRAKSAPEPKDEPLQHPRVKVRPTSKSWSPLSTHIHNQDRHLPHFNSVRSAQKPEKVLDQKLKRKIARGRLDIDATLDLHGMRQPEARSALIHFVSRAYERGNRNILVITGKGVKRTGFAEFEQRGVLRHLVPGWLKEPALFHMVSGVDQAAQQHGGDGALYVRLKKVGK